MKPVLKALITDLLPPLVIRRLSKFVGRRNSWSGHYSNWASAAAASSGYDGATIFESVRSAAAAVRDGAAIWERDAICFPHEEYNWHLLACLMTVAARSKSALHVLDFGGAFGSSYMQHRKILSALRECSWTVVEQERIVACGKTEFSTEILSFQDTLEQGFSAKPINVVLLSSVLQYLENPYELLEKIAALAPSAIIIDRTPLALTGERIAIQHVPRSIYSASYPCRFLDKARLEAVMAPLGRLTPWFASQVDPVGFWGVMSYAGEDK